MAVGCKSKSIINEHKEHCQRISNAHELIRSKLSQLATDRAQLADLQAREPSNWDFDQIVALRDSIAALKLDVRQLRAQHDELAYLSDTGEILLSYFETYENASGGAGPSTQKHSAAGLQAEPAGAGSGQCASAGGPSSKILSFFGKASASAASSSAAGATAARGLTKSNGQRRQAAPGSSALCAGGSAEPSGTCGVPAPALHNNRGSMYEKYMEAVDRNYVRQFPEEADACPFCGCREKQLVSHEGLEYCTSCHHTQKLLMEADKPSYKEPPNEVTYYSYKRANHYNEWINQIQGKEYTEIPNEIIDSILVELKKQKITNMASLTPKKVREILRKLKINRYYEHTSFIMYKLNGIPPPRLGEETEEKLRQMFDAIQVPYLRHGPPGRKNFLSYSYVLHKLLQIMGKHEFLMYFPLLKSRDKCYQSDIVWKKICADLGWPFIRSI